MTLTAIIPTLRCSIPDPLDHTRWPEHTYVTVSDVVVAGVSMVRLSEWCGTPCVHTDDTTTVILTRVQHLEARADGTISAWLDADLTGVGADPSEARLIGRASHARERNVRIGSLRITSPADLVVGDLLAIPAQGRIALRHVDPRRRNARHPQNEPTDSTGICGR